MRDSRNFTVFWLCAVLAMAIALGAVGLVVLFDGLAITHPDKPGYIRLKPGLGALSLLLGLALGGKKLSERLLLARKLKAEPGN